MTTLPQGTSLSPAELRRRLAADEDLMVVSWELLGNGGDVPWFVVDVDPVYAS